MKKAKKLSKKVKFDRKNIAILAGLLAVAGIYIIYRASATGWVNADIRINGQFIKAIDIGAGARTVWAVGEDGQEYKRSGSSWTNPAGGGEAVRIDVDDAGQPWKVTRLGHIFKKYNSTGYWEPIALPRGVLAKDIGISAYGGGVNMIDRNGCLYRYSLETFTRIHEVTECNAKNVEAYSGTVYWTTTSNVAYSGKYTTSGFVKTRLGTVAIQDMARGGNSRLWGVGTSATSSGNYSPYIWYGSKWNLRSGGIKRISVESSGNLWGVNAGGHVYHWDY